MNHLLDTLEKTSFDISIDTHSDSTYVKNNNGSYLFGFVVEYDIERKPDDFKAILRNITDIEIYRLGEFIELDDDTHSKVIDILKKKVNSQIN